VSGLWASEAIRSTARLAACRGSNPALEKNGGEDESAQMLFLRKENQRLGHRIDELKQVEGFSKRCS